MKTIYISTPNTIQDDYGFFERPWESAGSELFDYSQIFKDFSLVNSNDVQNKPHNIYINENLDIVFEVAAIGVNKDEIKVNSKDTILNIAIEHDEQNEVTKEKVLVNKLVKSDFKLSYDVGEDYNLEKTSVSLNKGLLKIIIPVHTEKKPKEHSFNIE